MSAIHKYEVPASGVVSLPHSHALLSFQEQNGALVVWAMVDPENAKVERRFRIVMTGEHFAGGYLGRYRATVQMSPRLVVHVFDAEENP